MPQQVFIITTEFTLDCLLWCAQNLEKKNSSYYHMDMPTVLEKLQQLFFQNCISALGSTAQLCHNSVDTMANM